MYVYLDVYRGQGNRNTELLAILTGDKFHDHETLRMCQELRNQREKELFTDAYGIYGKHNRKKNFISYCEELAEKQKSPNTRLSWGNAIKHLQTFGGENLIFGELNQQFIEDFREYLLNKVKLSPNSAQVYLARIKTALRRAVSQNILPNNPAANVSIKGKAKLPVHLSIEEIRKLNKTHCANDQVKVAFLFACFTGLRYSDVQALTWDKIRDGYLEFSQQKTGEAERMPLSEQAKEILKAQETAKPSPNLRRKIPKNSVFFMPTQPVIDKQLKAWAKAAGITKSISFHKSRHTFATLSLSSGVDLFTVSKLLGHRDLQSTQIYAKVIDEKKKQAVNMLPTIG